MYVLGETSTHSLIFFRFILLQHCYGDWMWLVDDWSKHLVQDEQNFLEKGRDFKMINRSWLVVDLPPLKNISSSQLGWNYIPQLFLESHSKFHGSSHHQPGYISAFLQISQISQGAVSQRHSLGPPFDGPIHLSAFHVLLGAMLQGGAPVSDSSLSWYKSFQFHELVYARYIMIYWLILFLRFINQTSLWGHHLEGT